MENKSEYRALWKNRENMYRFLARIYKKEISESLLLQLLNMEVPDHCADRQMEEGYRELKEYLKQLSCPDGNNSNMGDGQSLDVSEAVTELAVDYAKIFLGAGESQGAAAFPYESVYTSPKKIVMQEAWEQVKTIYSSKGLARNEKLPADVLEDHASLELEYMSLLCRASLEGNEEQQNVKKAWTEQEEFFTEHLNNWLFHLCEDIIKYADTRFYRSVAQITKGFLALEQKLFDEINHVKDIKAEKQYIVSCEASEKDLDELIKKWKKQYRVYGPKLLEKRGAQNKDLIRYHEIDSVREIEWNQQSDFSPKEIYYPIIQTLLHFTEENCTQTSMNDTRGILVFARPCDINAIKRSDNIFLKNGGHADLYYQRLRDKVKFIMMECREGFENCYCVSMGANKTADYSIALRRDSGNFLVQVKEEAFSPWFEPFREVAFEPEFPTENKRAVTLPDIRTPEELKKASGLQFWKEFDEKCIGCGGCNAVCGTCTCFDTVDVIYNETSRDGERRRVWSSCMLDTFTMTAGGNRARKTPGENMRFKTLHKVYDYKKRFGGKENMCVGCGRCVIRCPRDISFPDIISRLSRELEMEG